VTWPLPAPGVIAGQVASVYESAPGLAGIDARSPNTLAGVNARAIEMAIFDLYLYQSYLAGELMPDTAIDTLDRHAAIWGVPRLQPTYATGTAPFLGTPGIVVPAGFLVVAPSQAIFQTLASGTIGGGGGVEIALRSLVTGAAQNLPTGTVCAAISPLGGLSPQSVVLDGMSGGTDLEATEAWRSRILARIREPANGGSADDYVNWAKAALSTVAYAEVLPAWGGLGNVGVAIAMTGPRVATSGEIAIVAAYIAPRRPVTANVTVLGATLVAVNISLHINPDNVATRAAVNAALALAFLRDAKIGGTTFMSRLDNAISGSGEYSHERFAPSADVAVTATQLPTLGSVSFT
jgi:uncharacterized phage protein gp47/JayE